MRKYAANIVTILACYVASVLGANTPPVLSALGKIIFPGTSPAASISASSGALTLAAGGPNQGINFNPSGTGRATITTAGGLRELVVANTSASGTESQVDLLANSDATFGLLMGKNDSGAATSGYNCANCAHVVNFANAALIFGVNNSALAGLTSTGLGVLNVAPSYALDVTGDTNTSGVFRKGGTAGISPTLTYLKSAGVTCTATFSGGIITVTGGAGCP